MSYYDNARNSYQEVHHEGKTSHELLAGAAAFAGMYEFEKKQREKGETVNHGFAKELLAAAVGYEVDKLAETKGLDFVDKQKAKHAAKEQAEGMYNQQHGGYDEYRPQNSHPYHQEEHHHHHRRD
ncbi:hypothetical protein AA313_de0208852 [Arthrobotrys entomopaga]|nr:hypothetical protein AA313_de0208852 [Arthrobotrys entomopaga]